MHYNGRPHFATSVIIYRDEHGILALCQIEMWSLDNISKNKMTSISSTPNDNSKSSYAVDSQTCSVYGQNGIYCSHTAREKTPWWKVDLEKTSVVFAVTIITRGYINSDRSRNLRIAVANDDSVPTPQTLSKINSWSLFIDYCHFQSSK
ncbi:unnamed protein product [Dimorphilus gyrociliatus]|uniref:Uncharacterized protein n=1 Tax=Dimorphilus gyrociliatus TaxID=2664684 RepID=A0A7I8WEX3_9ANNE|nr:unnamed protein product [Dimorphilus gyrociliatus]